MSFKKWIKTPRNLMYMGASFLIAASVWRWFVHPSAQMPEGMVDGGLGFLYGLAFGCLLLAVVRVSRQRQSRQ